MAFVYDCFLKIKGSNMFFAYFFIFIFYIILRKDKREKIIFLPFLVVLLGTVFNVLVAEKISVFFNVTDVYYRFFWCIPLVIMVSYFLTHIVFYTKKPVHNMLLFALVAVTIMLSGIPLLNISQKATNSYKVPQPLIPITDIIKADSDGDSPVVAFDYDLNLYARQYDASLMLSLNRDYVIDVYAISQVGVTDNDRNSEEYLNQKILIETVMMGKPADSGAIAHALQFTHTEYMVFKKDLQIEDQLMMANCSLVEEVGGFYIYRNDGL